LQLNPKSCKVFFMSSKGRAKKGGEWGCNGQWYRGGWFLPTSETTIQGQFNTGEKKKGSGQRKEEYENYKWAVPPEGKTSILRLLNCHEAACIVTRPDDYDVDNLAPSHVEVIESLGGDMEEIRRLVRLYEAGERWAAA
jgi:hypothetical protein